MLYFITGHSEPSHAILRLNYVPKRFAGMKLGQKKVWSKFPKEVDSWQLNEHKSSNICFAVDQGPLIPAHKIWWVKKKEI